jgi:PAS domain S-box-containing protein
VEQLGGYTQSEVIGQSVTKFIHPDDLAPLMESFQKTVSGNLQPFEYRILAKSGEVHWVRTSSRPIIKEDSIVGLRAVLMDITDRKRAEEALRQSEERLHRAHDETVLMLAAAAEAHDLATGQHLQGVRAVTTALALELGHSNDDAQALGLAAVLHDIGKVRVPESVLSNPGTLSAQEWELMKQHSIWGSEFLTGRSGFELAAAIARSHHERWDGTGYPEGLSGEDIPEAATIVAVADSLDAITNNRPYRAGRSVAGALREVAACSGTQFSLRVVEALVRLHKEKRLPISSRRKLTRTRT